MTVEEMIDKVRDKYIEQIYALKAEAEKNSKELEVYKKALELACWDLDNYTDTYYVTLMNEYLQKAREQNNDT